MFGSDRAAVQLCELSAQEFEISAEQLQRLLDANVWDLDGFLEHYVEELGWAFELTDGAIDDVDFVQESLFPDAVAALLGLAKYVTDGSYVEFSLIDDGVSLRWEFDGGRAYESIDGEPRGTPEYFS